MTAPADQLSPERRRGDQRWVHGRGHGVRRSRGDRRADRLGGDQLSPVPASPLAPCRSRPRFEERRDAFVGAGHALHSASGAADGWGAMVDPGSHEPAGVPAGDVAVRHRRRVGPRHAALAAFLVLSGLLEFVRVSQNGFANGFYSAAVKSMLRSWHNFFVASDPNGFIASSTSSCRSRCGCRA